jgi:hypothetical protein
MEIHLQAIIAVKLLGVAIILLFLAVSFVFAVFVLDAVRSGRVRQRFAPQDTLRSKTPVQFWLVLGAFVLFPMVALYAVVRIILSITGAVP